MLKIQKKIRKIFFVFDIIVSHLVALNCLYKADNASHRLSMSYQTALGFCLLLKETFSKATTFTVINKSCKVPAIQIATVFRPIFFVICLRVL